jgi:MYXO-CTERM domain-containing protein
MTLKNVVAGGLAGVLMAAASPALAQQTTGTVDPGTATAPPVGDVQSPDAGALGADATAAAQADPGTGLTTTDPALTTPPDAGATGTTATVPPVTTAPDPALAAPVATTEVEDDEDDGFDLGWLGLAGLLGLLGLRKRNDRIETHAPTTTTTAR